MTNNKMTVFIPTYRRPLSLLKTLDSLLLQKTTLKFDVVVADNDDKNREGYYTANRWAAENGWEHKLRVIVVKERGLSNCRNAGLKEAFSDVEALIVCMIDDDAVADEFWLSSVEIIASDDNKHVIGGPTVYTFPPNSPETIKKSSMFGVPWSASGFVKTLRSSNNCMIKREVWEKLGPELFSQKFSRSGGEDTDFFVRCRLNGFAFYWSQDTKVFEPVPPERCTEAWVLKRHKLSATNSARVDCINNGYLFGFLRQFFYALKESIGAVIKLMSSDPDKRFKGRMRVQGVIGRLYGLIGGINEFY